MTFTFDDLPELHDDLTATYSPEDDKLRIYAGVRLDADLWAYMKSHGFKWAPKQELFVVYWSPIREDICVRLAGEIEAEGISLAERAEAKAARLETIAENAERRANDYFERAREYSARFADGQPILVGHHSERSARVAQKRADNAMRASVENTKKIDYWVYKHNGVLRHAESKFDARAIQNRIKKLLADLRSQQRMINEKHKALAVWQKLDAATDKGEHWAEKVKFCAGCHAYTPFSFDKPSYYSLLESGEMTHQAVVSARITSLNNFFTDEDGAKLRHRIINHYLGRLSFERGLLGAVSRFDRELTPAILQTFARTHGAEKPKATKTADGWTITSATPLPIHLCNGDTLTQTSAEWCDMMQGIGYSVPVKAARPAKPPLLNLDCQGVIVENRYRRETITMQRKEMTKAEYAAMHNDYKGTQYSKCKTFRVRTVMVDFTLKYVFLTDSKKHELPESEAIVKEVEAV